MFRKQIMIGLWFCLIGQARAQEVNKEVRTAYLNMRYGLSTYKSKLLASNDTGGVAAYALGVHVGDSRSVGVEISRDQMQQAFELNNSSLTSVWQDFAITYRWGWVYLGAIMGNAEIEAKDTSGPMFSLIGSGFGGQAGLHIPINRALFVIDVRSVALNQITEKDEKAVTLGPRMDIDIGAVIDVTRRALDALIGYQYRTYSVTYNGTANAELVTQTYVGLRLGMDF